MSVTQVRPRTQELLAQMKDGKLYRRAYEEGMNLSTWLEREDPSEGYKDGLDAYSRMLKVSDIIVRSIPQVGIWADTMEAFEQNDNTRALIPEWIARQARAVAYGARPESSGIGRLRDIFLSDDYAANTIMRPYVDDPTPIVQQITPQIPLAALVARTTGIKGVDYRAFYLTRVTQDLRQVRVVESTEVPKSKLSGGEHTITLHKYGRALETSYEQIRRLQIDLVAVFIQLMAVQAEVDKVDAALDVLVNGDGNSGTSPTVSALTTLDTDAAAGTLTLAGYLRWKMQFKNPYVMTAFLGQEDSILQALLLTTGTANLPPALISQQLAGGFGGFTPINPNLSNNIRVGWLASAPSLKLVGFDQRMALEHVTEIGGDITEIEKFANRQTQELIMTTVDGFRTLDPNATNILDIDA